MLASTTEFGRLFQIFTIRAFVLYSFRWRSGGMISIINCISLPLNLPHRQHWQTNRYDAIWQREIQSWNRRRLRHSDTRWNSAQSLDQWPVSPRETVFALLNHWQVSTLWTPVAGSRRNTTASLIGCRHQLTDHVVFLRTQDRLHIAEKHYFQ